MTALAAKRPAFRPAEPSDITAFLRAETAAAHRDLEASLDLLSHPADAARITRVLERFHGFHAVWEAELRAWGSTASFHAPRARLEHLARDLAALGRSPEHLATLPRCEAARALTADEAHALGSFYVLEGSTLGGQVIARALAGQAWLPPAGLSYFDPYPGRAGQMWREFRAWLQTHPAAEARDAVAQGAQRTFAVLQGWLCA